MKICRENSSLIKIGQKYQIILHDDLCVSYVGRDICSATIKETYCCVSMATLSVLLYCCQRIYVRQQYKGNALLHIFGFVSVMYKPYFIQC